MKKIIFLMLIPLISFTDIRSDLYKALVFINKQIETIDASRGFELTYHRYKGTLFYKYKKENIKSKNLLILTHGGAFVSHNIFNRYFSLTEKLMYRASEDFETILIDIKGEKYPTQSEELNNVIEYASNKYENIILMGDSSGGNVVLSTSLMRRDKNQKIADALILLSPWTDLTNTVDSRITRANLDILLTNFGELPELMINNPYIKEEENIRDPYISPIFADYNKFPKTLIQVGTDEVLYDDSSLLKEKMLNDNVDVKLEIYENMTHVFQLFPFYSKTNEAIENIVKFLDEVYYDKRIKDK